MSEAILQTSDEGPLSAANRESLELHRRIVTSGIPGVLSLSGGRLQYRSELNSVDIDLEGGSIGLAHFLMRQPDRPFLKSDMSEVMPRIYEPIFAYNQIARRFQSSPVRNHFIRFGRGAGTWYGFLTDNENPGKLIEQGRAIVSGSVNTSRRKEKTLTVFNELERFYSGSDKERFKKRAVSGMGAAAIILCIGGTKWYVHHRRTTRAVD